MSGSEHYTPGKSSLETVIATSELARRKSKPRIEGKEEAATLLHLSQYLAKNPQEFFQVLVDSAMHLSDADSAGISLHNEKEHRFVWPAVAGGLSPYIREGTPRDFGPCGTVLDRDCTVMMQFPGRYFSYLEPITPPLHEVLLVPFHVDGKAVGTIWAVSHREDRKFDSEDRRILEELSTFAASAYKILVECGLLEPYLAVKHA